MTAARQVQLANESNATFELQRHNPGVTEFSEMPARGHSLIIDDAWPEVAAAVLAFISPPHVGGQGVTVGREITKDHPERTVLTQVRPAVPREW